MIHLSTDQMKTKLCNQIGFGTVQLGMPYGPENEPPPNELEALTLLRHAYDMGIDYFDTAPDYGSAEYLVGKTFKDFKTRPLIATKISLPKSTNTLEIKQHIVNQIETSRRQLYSEKLPIVFLHSIVGDIFHPPLLDVLYELNQQGVVENWGVTTYGFCAPLRALEFPNIFTTIQIPFNVVNRTILSVLLAHPNSYNFTFVVRSIFLQGLLTGKYQLTSNQFTPLEPTFDSLKRLADDAYLSLTELCIRYAAYKTGVGTALFGTQSLSELRKNFNNYSKGPLNNDIIEVIDDILVERVDLLDPRNWL